MENTLFNIKINTCKIMKRINFFVNSKTATMLTLTRNLLYIAQTFLNLALIKFHELVSSSNTFLNRNGLNIIPFLAATICRNKPLFCRQYTEQSKGKATPVQA